jgi:hypothetical protein
MPDLSSIQFSAADHKRYNKALKEIREDLTLIDHSIRRVATNLELIQSKRLYLCGKYGTFAEFCQKEIGKTRQHVYRLISAKAVLDNLLEAGVPESDLPETERLCREIHKSCKDPEDQARLWRVVHGAVKRAGRGGAEVIDVQEGAKEVLGKDSGASQRQQTELIQKFEGINRSLRVGLSFEVLEPAFRRRLVVVLMEIAEAVGTLLRSLNSNAVTGRTDETKAE